MTEDQMPQDPRDVDDAELAAEDPPPLPGAGDDPIPGVTEAGDAQGTTVEPAGADRDVPAGEDYAGSGF